MEETMKKLILSLLVVAGLFTLAACGGSTEPVNEDQAAVDNARDSLIVSGLDRVTGNLNLPTAGRNGTTVTWTSSNPSVISNTGQVTRPEEGQSNAVVTLTATVRLNEASAQRTFEALVLAFEPSNSFTDWPTLYEASSINDLVTIEGLVSNVFDGGFFVFDGQYHMGVYVGSGGTGGGLVEVGDEVRVTGSYARYYTLYQLSDLQETVVLSSGNELDIPVTPITIEEFAALDLDDPLVHGQFFEVTGTLVAKGNFNNLFLESDASDAEILVYFYSDAASLAALDPFIGRTITITLAYYTLHTLNGIMASYYGDGSEVVIAELTEAQKLALDRDVLLGTRFLTFGDDITLPSTGANDTVFSDWKSSNTDLILDDGSYVVMPGTPTNVTFTVTATNGEETQELEVTVRSLAEVSIEDALKVPSGEFVMFTGKVVEIIAPNSGFYVYDETGLIYVRDTAFWSANRDDVKIGDSWTFVGARGLFRGLPQVEALRLYEPSDEVFADDPLLGFTTLQDIKDGNIVPGGRYLIYGTATVIEGRFTDYRVQTGDVFVQLHHNANNSAIADFDGEEIVIEVRPFQWDSPTPFVTYTKTADDVSTDPLTQAEQNELAAVTAATEAKLFNIVREDLNLVTTGLFDTTISWSSSNPSVISSTGEVTFGSEETTVTLTVTVGSFSKDYEVIVGEATLNLSEIYDVALGTEIFTRGIVTNLVNNNQRAVIEDENGGLFLFGVDNYSFKLGDEVIVRGTKSEFRGLIQLSNITQLEVLRSNLDLPEPVAVDFSKESLLEYQNRSVNIVGLFLSNPPQITGTGGVNFNLVDESNEVVIIFRLESETYLGKERRDEIVELLNSLSDGDGIDFTGVLMGWFNNPQLIITDLDQIVIRD
jgi:glycosidase